MQQPSFDFVAFLVDNFKTHQGLMAFLRAFGVDAPKENTVYQWFRRGSVPAEWAMLLAGLLELERGAANIGKYVRL